MISLFIVNLSGFLSFLFINHVVLTIVLKDFYASNLKRHTIILNGVISPYVPAVLLLIITAISGIDIFVLAQTYTISDAFWHGIILGFIIYAFHNFFNLTLLKEHRWRLAVIDTIHGTLLIGIVSSIMFLVRSNF
jgi:uncharacterized membrane protein